MYDLPFKISSSGLVDVQANDSTVTLKMNDFEIELLMDKKTKEHRLVIKNEDDTYSQTNINSIFDYNRCFIRTPRFLY